GDLIYTAQLKLAPATAAAPRPSFQADAVSDLSTGQVGMAPGAWVVLKGSLLASQTAYWAPVSGKALDTQLAGVSVKVNGVAAPLLFTSPNQIAFLVPAGTPEGDVPVVVESEGRASEQVFVRNSAVLPAFVTVPEPNSSSPKLYATATT